MNNKEKVKEIIKELKISSVDDMNLLAEEMDTFENDDIDGLDFELLSESNNSDNYGKCQLCGKKRKWEDDGEPCPNCGHDHIIHRNE
jgi:rubrerythrin